MESHKELYNEIPPAVKSVMSTAAAAVDIFAKGNSRTLSKNVLSHSRIVRVAILGDSRMSVTK